MSLPKLLITVPIVACLAAPMASSQDTGSPPLRAVEQNQPQRSLEEMKKRADAFMTRLEAEQEKINQQQMDSRLGDRVQLTFMTCVVHDVEITNAINLPGLGRERRAEEGSLFAIVNLTLENISLCTQNADFSRTALVDAEGTNYGIRNEANGLMTFVNTSPSWILTMAVAQPGVPIDTRMAFIIPEESANGPLSLALGGPYQSHVDVQLRKRGTDDLPAESERTTPHWALDMAPWLEARPARMEVGVNEPTDIGDNRYTINKIEFLEHIGRRRGTATPESIFLAIDFTIDNLTDEEEKKFKPRLNVVDGQGRKYYQLNSHGTGRLDISPRGNATARKYFLIPRSSQGGALDLEIVNRVSFHDHHTGWVRLQQAPAS